MEKNLNDKPLGRPPAEGPRINIRFNNPEQLAELEKTITRINKKSEFGSSVSRNGFVIESIMEAIRQAR